MKNAIEMGSGAMICVPSFIKIGSTILKLIGGRGYRRRYRFGDSIGPLLSFQNDESRLVTRSS
jgi:hypothetical protein